MRIISEIDELRAIRSKLEAPIGFVPTMGALHAGHASLVHAARNQCETVVASIFVNPLQFGPQEDYQRYPRTPKDDYAILESLGVDVVFAPEAEVMFPAEQEIFVEAVTLARYFEGARRPTHFRGVATVVLKLLNIVGPNKAYFGQKDAQQLALVRRMVADLNLPVEIVACPTVREPDGLALSSRNAYLSAEDRRDAVKLHIALDYVAEKLEIGTSDVSGTIAEAVELLAPLRPDYIGVVHPSSFEPLETAPPSAELLVVGAAFAGNTRLIDNVGVRTPAAITVS